MKRRIAALLLALVLTVSLGACAPDNIVKPEPQPPQTEKPDTDTEAEAKPAQSQQEDDSKLTDGAKYFKNKKLNEAVRPSGDLDSAALVAYKTPQLSGVSLTAYLPETSAFSAGKLSASEWMLEAAKEYGVKLSLFLRPDSTLYSSQLIAQKSGMTLDIIGTHIGDSAGCMSLMSDAGDIVSIKNNMFMSASVFTKSGGKLFAPLGSTRVLWYNRRLITTDLPGDSAWSTDTLSGIAMSMGGNRIIECSNWLEFGSAGKNQASGLDGAGYCLTLTDENVIDTYEAFGSIFNRDSDTSVSGFDFKSGNTVFCYTDTPEKGDFELGFKPIPKFGADGKAVCGFSGDALGLSKTANADVSAAACAFMTLWCARYTEARADKLMYELSLSASDTDAYFTLGESCGGLYTVDGQISRLFESPFMPTQLYGNPDTVYNTFAAAYTRTDVLNDRYR